MVGVVSFRFRVCCFTWKNISSNFATLHLVLADRRATARTTTSLSHAASRQKKTAYCAHALHNFSEEHLSVLANPDTLASFNTEVVDPLLHSEPSKAQEYLQGLLATADVGFTPVLRRRPVPLTDGPPDDDYIVSLNIASLKSTHLYIDHVYRKIAELATLLAGSDIPKSPLDYVRLQTLQSYDGRDVPGNFNPTTQTVVATNKFSILSQGNLRPMSKDVLETLLISTLRLRGGDAVSNMPLTVLRHRRRPHN